MTGAGGLPLSAVPGLLTVVLPLFMNWVQYCSSLPVLDHCSRRVLWPHLPPTSGDNGFRVKIAGHDSDTYTPGHVHTVSLDSTYGGQSFQGFLLVAVPLNAQDESTAMGSFQALSSTMSELSPRCPYVVTHTDIEPKQSVHVLWTAPPSGSGCLEFRATVVQNHKQWHKDDGALTKRLCEKGQTVEHWNLR
jgi:hypothetical protein